jgi:hypothetical protein
MQQFLSDKSKRFDCQFPLPSPCCTWDRPTLWWDLDPTRSVSKVALVINARLMSGIHPVLQPIRLRLAQRKDRLLIWSARNDVNSCVKLN